MSFFFFSAAARSAISRWYSSIPGGAPIDMAGSKPQLTRESKMTRESQMTRNKDD
jgi:hypothetical protein